MTPPGRPLAALEQPGYHITIKLFLMNLNKKYIGIPFLMLEQPQHISLHDCATYRDL